MRSRIAAKDKHCTRAAESVAAQQASVGIAEEPDADIFLSRTLLRESRDSFLHQLLMRRRRISREN